MCRVLLGAGTGLFLPFTAGLIASFFQGDERAQMIGLQSTSVGVGNIVTSILAGVLATVFWKLSFLIYGFGLITLVMVIFWLPEPEMVHRKNDRLTMSMYLNPGVLWVCCTLFFYAILYFGFFGYIAFVIDQNHFGDATDSGIATMLMTAGTMSIGLVFGQLVKILKRLTLSAALILNAMGFLILAQATSMGQIYAGSLCLGVGFGVLMPYAVHLLNTYSDESAYNYSNGLLMVAVNIGTAVGPKVLVAVGKAFDNSTGQFIFQFCAICLTLTAALAIVWLAIPQKTSTQMASK
ncbi:MAG: MFS transporter [Desulfopila sp.]